MRSLARRASSSQVSYCSFSSRTDRRALRGTEVGIGGDGMDGDGVRGGSFAGGRLPRRCGRGHSGWVDLRLCFHSRRLHLRELFSKKLGILQERPSLLVVNCVYFHKCRRMALMLLSENSVMLFSECRKAPPMFLLIGKPRKVDWSDWDHIIIEIRPIISRRSPDC